VTITRAQALTHNKIAEAKQSKTDASGATSKRFKAKFRSNITGKPALALQQNNHPSTKKLAIALTITNNPCGAF